MGKYQHNGDSAIYEAMGPDGPNLLVIGNY